MKHLLLPVIAGIFIMCNTNGKYNSQQVYYDTTGSDKTTQQENTLSGNWVLMPVLASDTASGHLPSLNFNLQDNFFTGYTGCNNMSGRFFMEGDSLVFTEQRVLSQTTCPGYNERVFIDNFTKTDHYKIEDGVLQLLVNKTVLSKWVRKGSLEDSTQKI